MKVLVYLFGAAALVFGLLYADSCSRLRDSTLTAQAIRSVWKADMGIAQKQISLRDSFVLVLEGQLKKDSSQHALKQKSLTGQITSLKGKLKERGVPIVIQDTIIYLQDSLIADLTNERDSMRNTAREIIDSLKSTMTQQKGQINLCDSLMKEIRIPPEPSRLSFGLSAGYGLMQTRGEVRAGVIFGPTLTYRIPIKINLRKLFRRKR